MRNLSRGCPSCGPRWGTGYTDSVGFPPRLTFRFDSAWTYREVHSHPDPVPFLHAHLCSAFLPPTLGPAEQESLSHQRSVLCGCVTNNPNRNAFFHSYGGPEVWNPYVGGTKLPLKGPRENPFLLLVASGVSRCPLACSCRVPVSASGLTQASPLPLPFSYRNACHRIWDPSDNLGWSYLEIPDFSTSAKTRFQNKAPPGGSGQTHPLVGMGDTNEPFFFQIQGFF